MKIGISSHSFGWAAGAETIETPNRITPFDLVRLASENNVELLQIADNMPLHELSKQSLSDFRDFAMANNVEIELGIKGSTRENLGCYLDLCDYFQCKLLRVVTDAKGYEPSPEEAIACLREAATTAEARGIRIAIENHDRFNSKVLKSIVDSVASANVGICLDTANSLFVSEGIEYVQSILGPHTMNLHVKDYAVERLPYLMGFTVEGRPAGEGDLNIPTIIRDLDDDVNIILEVWTTPESTIEQTIQKEHEWVIKGLANLRRIVAG